MRIVLVGPDRAEYKTIVPPVGDVTISVVGGKIQIDIATDTEFVPDDHRVRVVETVGQQSTGGS
jgi:hypothetical protein